MNFYKICPYLLYLGCSFLSLVLLTQCTTVALVGGGTAVSTMVFRDKPAGETVTDTVISARVSKEIYKINPDIHALVGINVQEGEVLLTGALPSEEQRRAVEIATWKVKNIKRVYNNIEISEKPPIYNYAKDAWITSQVKTKLLAIPSIRSLNYSIKTVNNVVYIFGIARTKAELDKVVDISSRIKGVERVMSYIRLK